MFHLGKLFGIFDEPLMWLLLWCAVAVWLISHRPLWAKRMLSAGGLALLLMGVMRLVDAPLRWLEQAYDVPSATTLERHVGIIVLGGSFSDPWLYQTHGQVPLNASAERLTEAVKLMRTHPTWTLVFSGGEGRVFTSGVTEGQLALQFFKDMGIDERRIIIEQQSRTTLENARRVQETLGERCRQPWLLVTSAWHMRRAMQSFEQTTCQLTPYPTDFQTSELTPWHEYSLLTGLRHLQLAMHEWLGIVYYLFK